MRPPALVALLVLLVLPTGARSATYDLVDTIHHPDQVDTFGQTMLVVGSHLFIAAPGEEPGYDFVRGSVYDVDLTGATPMRRLTVPTGTGALGFSLAFSGGRLVTGEPTTREPAGYLGKVHVWDIASAALVRTIDNPNPLDGGELGYALAAVGDRVVVSAPYPPRGPSSRYLIRVIDVASGAVERTFESTRGGFGFQLAVVGDRLLVSAVEGSVNVVHVYSLATGALERTLHAPPSAGGSLFGFTLTPIGAHVVVTAVTYGTQHAAWVFDPATDAVVRTLEVPAGTTVEQFGIAATAVGNAVAIGATHPSGDPALSGVLVFDPATGAHLATITHPTARIFANALASDGRDLFVHGILDGEHVVFRYAPTAAACTRTIGDARLVVAKLGDATGNETLRFEGRLAADASGDLPANVAAAGARIRIVDANGTALLALPDVPGGVRGRGCGPGDGWRLDRTRTRAVYVNRSGALDAACTPGSAQGLRRIEVRRHAARGEIGFRLRVDGATIASPTPPVDASIELGDAAACGASTLVCRRSGRGRLLHCASR